MDKKNDLDDLSPAGKAIVLTGALLGLCAGGAAIFYWSLGMIPSVFLGMGGPILGIGIARPIALALTKKKE